MKIKTIFKNIFISLFSFTVFLSSSDVTLKAQEKPFDFSISNSNNTKTISSSDIIEKILGQTGVVTSQERAFLETSNYNLSYEGQISTSKVYVEQDASINVIAYESVYSDINNELHTWIPYSASIGDDVKYFECINDSYELSFTNVDDKYESVVVSYSTNYNLKSIYVNEMLNYAYNTAKYYVDNNVLENQEIEYNEKYQQYLKDKAAYDNYLLELKAYDQNKIEYEQYLKDKRQYDYQLSLYNQYLDEYQKYVEEKQLYDNYDVLMQQYNEDYILYQNYLNDKASYDVEYEAYLQNYSKYEQNMQKVNYQLALMEFIKTPVTSLKRTLYDAIMGTTVTSVLERKEDLAQLNVEEKVINQAEEATIALRDIFTAYFSLNNDAEKYGYYKSNYTSIKKNLELLLQSLEKLYRSGLVSNVLNQMDKKEKYLILVAQLVVICNSIDQNIVKNYEGVYATASIYADVFDESWTIDGKSVEQILENEHFIDDIDGFEYPLASGYPNKPDMPISPSIVNEPVKPVLIPEPTEPTKVEEPSKIEEVSEPILPSEVICPTEPEYEEDQIMVDLISIYNNGELILRDEITSDYQYTIYSEVEKKYKNTNVLNVQFCNESGDDLLSIDVEYGSYIAYQDSKIITDYISGKEKGDEKYNSYSFSHWEYENGEMLDLNNVLKTGKVIAIFNAGDIKKYTITWKVQEHTFTEQYEYGKVPEYKGDYFEVVEGNYFSKFSEWDSNILSVSENRTYTANYVSTPIVEMDNKTLNVALIQNTITIETLSNSSQIEIDLSNVFSLLFDEDSNQKIVIENENFTLEIPTYEAMLLKVRKHSTIKSVILDKGNSTIDIGIIVYDENGDKVDDSYLFNLTIVGQFDLTHSSLYILNDDAIYSKVRCVVSSTFISSTINSLSSYSVKTLYTINVSCSIDASLLIAATSYSYNELVTFETSANKLGIEIEISIVSNGKNIEFSNNSFLMPNDDVYIIVRTKDINYTITFIVNDEVVSERQYKYGEEIQKPFNPQKASDGTYKYNFVGWDKEITSVSGDETYTAIFEQQLIEKKDNYKVSIIKIVKIVGAISIVLIAALITFLVLKKKKIFLKKR